MRRRGLRVWLGKAWRGLRSPTGRTLDDYHGGRLPLTINDLVDGRQPDGPAHQARLGEAVGLVIDHAIATRGAHAHAKSPLGHLADAWTRLVLKDQPRDERQGEERPTSPEEPKPAEATQADGDDDGGKAAHDPT